MNQKRNASIDILRLIFATGVVLGHTYCFYDISPGIAYWISRVIPRMSVPFFFCISGYYFNKSLLSGKNSWKKQVKGILAVYGVWTLLYYFLSLLMTIKDHESIRKFLLLRVRYFFFDGSFYHFWYFPALIYTILIVAFFYGIGKNKGLKFLAGTSLVLYLFAFLGTEYCGIGRQIPGLSAIYDLPYYETLRGIFCMGLPFFMIGYFLNTCKDYFDSMSNKKASIIFIITYACYIGEAIYAKVSTSQAAASEDLAVAFFMLPALFMLFVNLLKHPMPEYFEQSVYCRKISNFMYYIHPLLILIVTTAASMVNITMTESILFLIVYPITLIGGYICCKTENRLTKFLV